MCKYLKMMLFNSEKKRKENTFWTPPPEKRLRDTNDRDMATCISTCLYQQRVAWIFTRSILRKHKVSMEGPLPFNYYMKLK